MSGKMTIRNLETYKNDGIVEINPPWVIVAA